jgi:hypothetical protein
VDGKYDVMLHVWLRVVPPRAVPQQPGGTTAKVRGFLMLQDIRRSVPLRGYVLQMIQSAALDGFRNKIFLR